MVACLQANGYSILSIQRLKDKRIVMSEITIMQLVRFLAGKQSWFVAVKFPWTARVTTCCYVQISRQQLSPDCADP